jgi:hypothetical protein
VPIPDPQTLLLPVLEELADDAEHQAKEIQEGMNQSNGKSCNLSGDC